jgi:hypothetical protein
MLFWCDGPGGWRPADRSLRDAYPAARSGVISPNGLYGSMGIGGMALAMRLRQRWPSVILNETHPKVLAYSLRRELHGDADPAAGIAWFAQHSGLDMTLIDGGHEFDAAISAWATREGLSRGWVDLVTEDPALLFPVGIVRYLCPERLVRGTAIPKSPSPRQGIRGGPRISRGYVNTETNRSSSGKPTCQGRIMGSVSMSFVAANADMNTGRMGPIFFRANVRGTQSVRRDWHTDIRRAAANLLPVVPRVIADRRLIAGSPRLTGLQSHHVRRSLRP